jgi:hypothetical protein
MRLPAVSEELRIPQVDKFLKGTRLSGAETLAIDRLDVSCLAA